MLSLAEVKGHLLAGKRLRSAPKENLGITVVYEVYRLRGEYVMDTIRNKELFDTDDDFADVDELYDEMTDVAKEWKVVK